MRVRPREPSDRPAVEALLREHHSLRVARLGEVLEPLDHPALLAELGGRVGREQDGCLAGVLTYVVRSDACEVLTLHAVESWRGAGTALLAGVGRIAAERGCTRLWLITTNDNVDALRFYQRRGFTLAALRAGAVDHSRARLKPEIPLVGAYGIPLRDELELERRIVPSDDR
jgi:GNAT superfamily N-acetyltransferase